ncbi:hypothetical protein CXB51_007610 [Gossypium anomalum]|uniref:Aminotransferase-like plant mobile domain-containing protein n=1 Tax=Gossypium anomalum TaxID=47600 RepID=A0A8J6D7A9_9ROSI|nr:hypothetical protein CXB51_007610 [Gossypium anomalum]
MAPGDTYVLPPIWGGNYYTVRRSSPTGLVYKWRSSDWAWKNARPVGHLRAVTWKSVPNDEEERLTYIKFTWLRENFQHLLSSPTQMDIIYTARVFILQLIGRILIGMLKPRALSSDKAVYENNGRLLPSTTVLGVIQNVIFGISEPPAMGNCTGNWAIVHHTCQQLFMSNVPLIHFHMVEWHNGSRVLKQFGCAQPISNPLVGIKEVHEMDKKGLGRDSLNWAKKHELYIFLWNDRHSRRLLLYVLEGGFSPMYEYTEWYMVHGKPFIFQGHYMLIPEDAQPEFSQWQQRNAGSHRNREARTPITEDIFPSAPSVTQYPLTPDYGVYDYTTFLSTPVGTLEAGPSNYQVPQQGARHRRQR